MSSQKIPMLSFDVEDWFHVENLSLEIDRASWDERELRVERNTYKLLDMLDAHGATATFFVLGWIAEKVPHLVTDIAERGHEIACHGYNHELVTDISIGNFEDDLCRSRELLENIIGGKVYGYRAPNYSITEEALDVLKKRGFAYDSSYFPSSMHDRYSKLQTIDRSAGNGISMAREGLLEVIVSTWRTSGVDLPWGGGGYFRIMPYPLFKLGVKRILKARGNFVFYLHPWEIDPGQPRINNIKSAYRFRHYFGLEKTESKLERLLTDFEFISIKEGLERLGYL